MEQVGFRLNAWEAGGGGGYKNGADGTAWALELRLQVFCCREGGSTERMDA